MTRMERADDPHRGTGICSTSTASCVCERADDPHRERERERERDRARETAMQAVAPARAEATGSAALLCPLITQ